jgi:hypothetical protein
MFRYRHVQFSVFRRAFGGVGEAGLQQFNIMNGDNGLSGLGVPAKSITIMNHGPGIVYYQLSSNGYDFGSVDGIDSGQGKAYAADESVYTAIINLFTDNAATTFSITAAPGEWTEEEFTELMDEVGS